MTDRKAAHIPEFDTLQVCPETLAGIQFWGIGGETLDLEPWRGAVGQELLDEVAAVDRCAVPNDHHRARHLAEQMLQERDDIGGIDGLVLAVEIQLARRRYRTDGREVVTRPPRWSLWSLLHKKSPEHALGTWTILHTCCSPVIWRRSMVSNLCTSRRSVLVRR
jgi:hypothetical protein